MMDRPPIGKNSRRGRPALARSGNGGGLLRMKVEAVGTKLGKGSMLVVP